MITTNLIPLMKLFRIKTYLPVNEKTKGMYSAVILNNPDLQTNMKFLENPLFVSNSKFFTYYIEPRYIEKIRSKQIKINYKHERDSIYEQINDKYKSIRTPLNTAQLNGKNVYYDISKYNEIFFNNIGSWGLQKKIEFYFEYLRSKIDSLTMKPYTLKTVFIDVGAWTSNNMNKVDNPVSYLYVAFKRFFELLSILGDIEFILYTDKACFRFNPSKANKNEFLLFKKLISTLSKNINYEDDKEIDIVDKEEVTDDDDSHYTPTNISDNIDDEKFNFTGEPVLDDEDAEDDDDEPELKFNTEKLVDDPDDDVNKQALDNIESDAEDSGIIDVPDEFSDEFGEIASIVKRSRSLRQPLSVASQKRNEELKVLQKNIKLGDQTIEELINVKAEDIDLIENDVSNKITSTNDNVKNIKFDNFEKVYNEKLMKSDMMKIITNLNDKSIPVYIRNIKVEDTSDELNYKDTYTIQLEDANRVRHSLTFDVPKFIDDKFLYINGSRKYIQKQLFMKPISKTGPDEVQICSNYNKIFIRRHGKKTSAQIEKFKKLTSTNMYGLIIKRGNVSKNNTSGKTTLEYDELSKSYISIKTKTVEVIFDQIEIENRIKEKSIKIPNGKVCVGFYLKTGMPLLLDTVSETIDGFTIIDYIVNSVGGELLTSYNDSKTSGGRYVYSTATIMGEKVPLILLLGYCEGLSTVLKKANINYRFSDKRSDAGPNESVVQFSDGYLIYDNIPFKNSILLNALQVLHTKLYTYDEFDETDVYMDLFAELYGARNLANAFNTFYEFMIDPITKEVLEKLGYPTDFVSVLLEGNSMLANNSYMVENNMNLFRIRSNEIVNCIIHQEVSKAYARYRDTSHTKNPVKMSIKKDQIIKRLVEINTVEEFSILNPIYEVDKLHAISPRGLNGMNSERAFTPDKRSFDSTMTGIIGISTSPDANVNYSIVI